MISQAGPSYFPTMTSPIRRRGGAITNLLTIPQKQEGREGNRWKVGEWRARDTMLTAPFLLLHSPSPFVSLLCLLSSNPRSRREPRLTISLTMLYTSGGKQWRTTTKNSGNRGTALLLLGVAPACQTHRYTSAC